MSIGPSNKFYPFAYRCSGMHITVDDRLCRTLTFNIAECEAALTNQNLHLQKTVRTAIERRLRRLRKEADS